MKNRRQHSQKLAEAANKNFVRFLKQAVPGLVAFKIN